MIVGGLYSVTAWRENDREGHSVGTAPTPKVHLSLSLTSPGKITACEAFNALERDVALDLLIVGGLYSVTAWRENDQEGHSVY